MVNFTEFLNCTVGNASIEYSHCLEEPAAYEDCPDPTICRTDAGDNLALAFGLTVGAGLATTLGALLPFLPLVRRRNTQFLAASMALAAGVMLYVSFTEIRTKSLDSFCCVVPDHFEVLATSCFFGGIALTALLDLLVWSLQRLDCGWCFCCGATSGARMRLKRVKFWTGDGGGATHQKLSGEGGGEEERPPGEDGWRKRGTAMRGKVRLQAVNRSHFDADSVDASTLILPPSNSGDLSTESSSEDSTKPTAQGLKEGCDVALEEVEVEVLAAAAAAAAGGGGGGKGGGGERETTFSEVVVAGAGTDVEVRTGENESASVQHSQTPTGVCVLCMPVHVHASVVSSFASKCRLYRALLLVTVIRERLGM